MVFNKNLETICQTNLQDIIQNPSHNIPPKTRQEIAEIFINDLTGKQGMEVRDSTLFMQKYGIFYPIFHIINHSDEWKILKEIARESPEVAGKIVNHFLDNVFAFLDASSARFTGLSDNIDESLSQILMEFLQVLESSQELWGRQIPEDIEFQNPDSEMNETLMELRDLLEQLTQSETSQYDTILSDLKNIQSVLNSITDHPDSEEGIPSQKLHNLIESLKENIAQSQDFSNIANQNQEKTESSLTKYRDIIDRFSKHEDESSIITGSQQDKQITQEEQEGTQTHPQQSDTGSSMNNSDPGVSHSKTDSNNEISQSDNESLIGEISDKIDELLEQNTDDENDKQAAEETEQFLSDSKNVSFLQSQISQQILRPLADNIASFLPHLETIEFLSAIFPGRGMDYSISPVHSKYLQNLEKYAAIVQKNEDLKKMVDLFGRIELEYGLKKISISPSGKTEMHSVTLSSDIARMLPMEASKLHHPTLRKKFYADLTEGRLLSYQLRGKHWADGTPKKRKRGPVVAMVDTSGSMHGAPETLAKAIILAIAKRMVRDKRDVKVILFSGPGSHVEIELTSRKKMAEEFLRFIQQRFGGGTDFDTAIRHGIDSLSEPEFQGADLLFVTDGLGAVTDQTLLNRWTEFKETYDARIFSCIVGNDNAGGLDEISDNIYFLSGNRWSASSSPAKMIKLIEGEKNADRIESPLSLMFRGPP